MFKYAGVFFLSLVMAAPSGTLELPATDNAAVVPFYDRSYAWVDSLMETLTLEEKIGQLFMVAAYSNKDVAHENAILELIEDYHIGGLIFMQGGPVRQARLTNTYQQASNTPLLIAMDAEWGPAMRLDSVMAFQRQLTWGALSSDTLVYQTGAEIARMLKRLGVQVSFSPVIDINNNPKNPVIGDRSFGEDKLNVALKGLAYMNGLQDQGVLACGKHFPGHGDTDADSHKTLPVISHGKTRLDTLELFPFQLLMNQGLGSIMLAHLFIPALDDTPGQASSLSTKVGRDLLRDSLGFRGLVFSDALNMQGVAAHFEPGELEVKAFLAGNDVLLFSQQVPRAIQSILAAVKDGRISEQRIDESVVRILKAKAFTGLDRWEPVVVKGITADLNSSKALQLKRQITAESITLVGQKDNFPVKDFTGKKVATLFVGASTPTAFQTAIEKYTPAQHFYMSSEAGEGSVAALTASLKNFDLVLVGVGNMKRSAASRFGIPSACMQLVREVSEATQTVAVLFGTPYAAGYFKTADHILIAYDESDYAQQCAAEMIAGAKPCRGILPVGSAPFKVNEGWQTASLQRLQWGIPEDAGMNTAVLTKLDSIAKACIDVLAAPGLTVLVARQGTVVWDKTYGHYKYDKKQPVSGQKIYDLASVTKVAATTLGLMKLYEEDLFKPTAQVQEYLPETQGTVVAGLRLNDVLTHRAGLKSWIPFYKQTLLPNGTLNPLYYNQVPISGFSVPVAPQVYLRDDYRDSIWAQITQTPLGTPGKYVYSDLGLYIARRVLERLSGETLDAYVSNAFYRPLGLQHTGFNPWQTFPVQQVVPTENDNYYRFQTVQGYVHDMGAAMMGGVEGHAGLFSTSHDLAVLFQMLLNGGTYGGRQYLKPETINYFTQRQHADSRRGLGWDKAEPDPSKGSPCSAYASHRTYGHQGFTGICVWADPEYDLLFIFLSNRVQPSADPNRLSSENIRNKMMDVVYESFLQGTSISGS